MIGALRGLLEERYDEAVLIDVQGVGYEVFVTQRSLAEMPPPGDAVRLYVHQVVREDAQTLYGFPTREERDLFRLLIEVSGVGPKSALNLLTLLSPKELVAAVQEGNVAQLARAQGIGKKTAQRLVVDLQPKLGVLQPLALGATSADPTAAEAVAALVALGAPELQAEELVRQVRRHLGPEASVETLVAAALKRLAPTQDDDE